jgi:hypothetical protein
MKKDAKNSKSKAKHLRVFPRVEKDIDTSRDVTRRKLPANASS